MSDAIYLDLEDNQIVLFADILGFSNAVRKNERVSMQDRGRLIVNFPRIYDIFFDGYTKERQESMGIKFLWVSDSIIVSAPIKNANALFYVLVDITNTLYCSGLSLRGAITIGKLYHQNNVWGPALIEAVENEKMIVKYPRILLKESYMQQLELEQNYSAFFELSDISGYMQFNYFDCYFAKLTSEYKDITSTLSVYSQFIQKSFEEAERPEHKEKHAWLANELLRVVRKYGAYIDSYLASHEKWSTITGDAKRIENHTPFIDFLSTITFDKVRT